ncbi:MAG: hemerythrin family protein [Synergistaceae bacterium]|jgi:hemerythrin-like metal-binding protein|nr:hemerythrin family protein [Synergistaceae bacterium]
MLWSKSLETGINLIDEQHKELFRQVDILLDQSNENRHKEALIFLDKYIQKHFSDEQKMQADSKYPKTVQHKKFHDDYVIVFRKLKEKYLKEGPSPANNMEINKTVVGWLKDHILVHDREFATYYKSLK